MQLIIHIDQTVIKFMRDRESRMGAPLRDLRNFAPAEQTRKPNSRRNVA